MRFVCGATKLRKTVTMKNIKNATIILLALFALVAVSCNKKKDTIVNIKVVDAGGYPVGGADVTLYPNGTIDTLDNYWEFCYGESGSGITSVSNSSGVASFNFNDCYQEGQAGFAVLDIDATKGSLNGTGIVKVIEEETVDEEVTVQ